MSSWSYGRPGDRLPETYQYKVNAGSGNTPILDQVLLGVGGTKSYTYGPAGHLEGVAAGANVIDFESDAEGRLASTGRAVADVAADFRYDGRSFLTQVQEATGDPPTEAASVQSIYDSAGLLHALRRKADPSDPEELVLHLYLAGRPVAQLTIDGIGAETWTYLTTDHLGTPLLATDDAGSLLWQGGLEPFGKDYQQGTPSGALETGLFLRLPGQWDDRTWTDATSGASVYYNVHRWYAPALGSYSRPDPFPRGFSIAEGYYRYAIGNPLRFTDPFGLFEIDPSCSDCPNPLNARDPRSLSLPILKEVGAFCGSKLDAIEDVNLRRCINESCHNGVIVCSKSEEDLCGQPDVLGYSRGAGGFIGHFLRRTGVMKLNREAVLCANKAANFMGFAGSTVIHEWAHGCGYDADRQSIPGIPDAR